MCDVSRIYTLVVHTYVVKVAVEWLARSLAHSLTGAEWFLARRFPLLADTCQAFCGAQILLLRVQEYATRPFHEPDDLTPLIPTLFL
jgi:hypothetical protein